MNKLWFWMDFYWDETKGVLKLLLMGGFIILIVKSPLLLRDFNQRNYDSETTAIVDKLILIEGFHQSETGTKVITKKYTINYHYVIDQNTFNQKEDIFRNELTIVQRIKIKKLKMGDSIRIKYESQMPNRAKLKID